jgi:hypothetical protein
MTLKQVRDLVNAALDSLRNGIVYDEERADFRSRILSVYVTLTSAEKALEGMSIPPKVVPVRYCLSLGPARLWNNVTGQYDEYGCRELFFIDGMYTESKFLAIKKVREIDGCGLREAKDQVDALQAHPRAIMKSF